MWGQLPLKKYYFYQNVESLHPAYGEHVHGGRPHSLLKKSNVIYFQLKKKTEKPGKGKN